MWLNGKMSPEMNAFELLEGKSAQQQRPSFSDSVKAHLERFTPVYCSEIQSVVVDLTCLNSQGKKIYINTNFKNQ